MLHRLWYTHLPVQTVTLLQNAEEHNQLQKFVSKLLLGSPNIKSHGQICRSRCSKTDWVMPKCLRFHGIIGNADGSTLWLWNSKISNQTVCVQQSTTWWPLWYTTPSRSSGNVGAGTGGMVAPGGRGAKFVVRILQSFITLLDHALRMFYINSRSITEMKIMSRQESPRIYDLGGRIDFGISDKFGITGGRMTQGWIILSNNGWLHVFTSSENRIHLEPKGRRHGVSNGLFGGAIWRIVAI